MSGIFEGKLIFNFAVLYEKLTVKVNCQKGAVCTQYLILAIYVMKEGLVMIFLLMLISKFKVCSITIPYMNQREMKERQKNNNQNTFYCKRIECWQEAGFFFIYYLSFKFFRDTRMLHFLAIIYIKTCFFLFKIYNAGILLHTDIQSLRVSLKNLKDK